MDTVERADIIARLAPYAPQSADWTHPQIELEIGMGNGLAMLERARAAPDRLFVGCEVYLNGLKTLLYHLQPSPGARPVQPNIRMTNTDARDLLAGLPAHCLDRILIPFPDPWPKARHHKRRIVNADMLTLCAKALKPTGELWVITDWPDYAYHALSQIYAHPAWALAQTDRAAADCKPSARLEDELGPHHLGMAPPWWVATKYQGKAQLAGRRPWFIRGMLY